MQIEKYAEEVREWIKPYFMHPAPLTTTHRCCIGIDNKVISIVYLDFINGKVDLFYSHDFDYVELENLPLVLSGIVEQYNLQQVPTTLLLPPEDYQIFLVDSMPVKSQELKEALQWRVRSLIAYPIENATIDYFNLPGKKGEKDNTMLTAVVAQTSTLKKVVDLFLKSGFLIKKIDIPEMALKNLAALYETDEKSTAFIYFYDQIAIINITRQKTIYFTRHINIPRQEGSADIQFEELSLELLRYFDYYQSQWRNAAPSRIFIAAKSEDSAEIAKKLSEHLSLPVEPYSLNTLFADSKDHLLLEKNGLLTLGCAIYEESNHAASGN